MEKRANLLDSTKNNDNYLFLNEVTQYVEKTILE